MGIYYTWVNATKRQRLEHGAFDGGVKLLASCGYDDEQTNAVLTLLATDWRGDFVAFLPDEGPCCTIDAEAGGRLGRLRELTSEYPLGYAEDHFDDITGIFKCAKGKFGWVMAPEGTDGDCVELDYTGPFDRDIVTYRYVINETTREWYDRERNDALIPGFDLIPVLLAPCRGYMRIGDEFTDEGGIWMGDDIRPSHEPPGAGYTDVTGHYTVW